MTVRRKLRRGAFLAARWFLQHSLVRRLVFPPVRWLVRRRLRALLGIDLRNVRVEHGLIYGCGGTVDLVLDMAVPEEGKGPFPAVVLLPGGSWQYYAQPVLMEAFLQILAQRGFVAVQPYYRLSPAARFPSALEDGKLAVRWLRAHAAQYSVVPDRIAAVGPSSGGHLACMIGLTGPADGFEGQGGCTEQSSQVQAVVDLFGITDLTDFPWRSEKEKGLLVPFLGATFAEAPDLYRKASPLEYVHPGAPPFLIIHGDADRSVPVGQSVYLAERLRAVGGSVQLTVVPGAGHGLGPSLFRETLEQVVGFLNAELRPGRS